MSRQSKVIFALFILGLGPEPALTKKKYLSPNLSIPLVEWLIFLSANQNDAKNVVGGSSVRELQSLFVREIVYRHVMF